MINDVELVPSYVATAYVVSLLAVFFIALTALASMTFADTLHGRRLIRRWLGHRLERSRMFWLLERRGLPPSRYIAQSAIADIRQHLRNCRRCTSKAICDQAVRRKHMAQDWSFCPNHHAVTALLRRTRV